MASKIEQTIANGMLLPGLRASPARFTGLWNPLKLNTIPAIATAVRIEGKSVLCSSPWMPTLKFSAWKPLAISSTAVSAGITSLNRVIAVFERANSFTLQKLNRKYITTSAAAISRPLVLSSPCPPGIW